MTRAGRYGCTAVALLSLLGFSPGPAKAAGVDPALAGKCKSLIYTKGA